MFYLKDIAAPEYQEFSTILWMVQLAQIDENARTTTDSPLDDLFNGKTAISHTVIDGKRVLISRELSEEESKEYKEKLETSLCMTNYKTFKLGGAKTLKSILISAAVRLNPFSTPAVQTLTCTDNVELDKVGDELTCFFAIIPQTNTTFNFLVSMLFSQMFESLYYKGSQIPNSRLPYHVRFLLDEFANVGKIPEFPQKISTCRKYNLSVTIVLQSIAQIKTLYKDDYETIIANCDTSICLGTNEQTTADYFSKKLGKATIRVRSTSGQKVGSGAGSHGYQQTGRELMMPDEIMTMPFDRCIVMMNHVNPFYDKKYDVEKHPLYKETGDSDKGNYYFIEKDPEFVCVGHSEDKEAQAVQNMNVDTKKMHSGKSITPKTIEEAIYGIIQKQTDDGEAYAIMKDVSGSSTNSLLTEMQAKVQSNIEKSMRMSKIPYANMEYRDPAFMVPVLRKCMSKDKITECLIFTKGIRLNTTACAAAYRKGVKSEADNPIKEICEQFTNNIEMVHNSADDVVILTFTIDDEQKPFLTNDLKFGMATHQKNVAEIVEDDDFDFV